MLSQFLVSEVFAFLLVFARLGAAFMLLPGFGEAYVAPRVRLFLALMFSLVLVPTQTLPPVPESIVSLVSLLAAEIITGLFIGIMTRLLIAAVHMGAAIIAYESSMLSALVPSLSQTQTQDTSIGNFLSVSIVVLLFVTDMHLLMLRGLAESYTVFPPGEFLPVSGFAEHAAGTINNAFRMAMQIAAPHVVIGVLLYLAAGVMARLMPNIQIFFILMPPQLLISFFILMLAVSAILMWYLEYFQGAVSALIPV